MLYFIQHRITYILIKTSSNDNLNHNNVTLIQSHYIRPPTWRRWISSHHASFYQYCLLSFNAAAHSHDRSSATLHHTSTMIEWCNAIDNPTSAEQGISPSTAAVSPSASSNKITSPTPFTISAPFAYSHLI